MMPAFAQPVAYPFVPESQIWVDGTSNNTPEWTVYATEIQGEVVLNPEAEFVLAAPGLESVRLVVPMRMIKSKKSSLMDRTMYKAMQVDEFPDVTYELANISAVSVTSDSTFTLEAAGSLTLGPETKEVSFPVTGTMRGGGMVAFMGSHSLLISDFGLQAPTAMFGSLRTGDEVTVRAELLIGPLE